MASAPKQVYIEQVHDAGQTQISRQATDKQIGRQSERERERERESAREYGEKGARTTCFLSDCLANTDSGSQKFMDKLVTRTLDSLDTDILCSFSFYAWLALDSSERQQAL